MEEFNREAKEQPRFVAPGKGGDEGGKEKQKGKRKSKRDLDTNSPEEHRDAVEATATGGWTVGHTEAQCCCK